MRLSVHHITRFEFDQLSGHSIHDVRLTPKPATGQRVLSWRIDGPGKRSEWIDGHGNQVTTFSVAAQHDAVEIAVAGLYEFSGADQWLRYGDTPTLPAPFWLRNVGIARHDASFDPVIDGLAERAADPTARVTVLHELMERVSKRIAYKSGVSTVDTTAATLRQRLPAERQSGAACRAHQPLLGRGLGARARLGGLRSRQRHFSARRLSPGRDRARLSRRRSGQRPPRGLRRSQDERHRLGAGGRLVPPPPSTAERS
jgi:hypothetical protein